MNRDPGNANRGASAGYLRFEKWMDVGFIAIMVLLAVLFVIKVST